MLKVAREFALEAGESFAIGCLLRSFGNWAGGGGRGNPWDPRPFPPCSFLPVCLPLLALASPKTSNVTAWCIEFTRILTLKGTRIYRKFRINFLSCSKSWIFSFSFFFWNFQSRNCRKNNCTDKNYLIRWNFASKSC